VLKYVSKGLFVAAAMFVATFVATEARASVISIANPGGTVSEIGARLRWGGSGFEASVYDSNPFNQSPTLNPGGTPFWQVGTAYGFRINFDAATGLFSLDLDVNDDNSFGAGETISRSVFAAPGQVSYLNTAFKYIMISGNESDSTARSNVSNLVINGSAQASLVPGGFLLDQFYKDSSDLAMPLITITGDLTFTVAGTSTERPAWDFRLRNAGPVPVVEAPEPSTIALIAMALLSMFGFGLMRRRGIA
jgi:hypothetical protein